MQYQIYDDYSGDLLAWIDDVKSLILAKDGIRVEANDEFEALPIPTYTDDGEVHLPTTTESADTEEISYVLHDEMEDFYKDLESGEALKRGDWIDLRSAEDVFIERGGNYLLSLGISMQLPEGYEAIVVPRSSTFKNFGLIQTNSMGVIDEDYCGTNDVWRFPCYATKNITISKGDRVCQFRIVKHQPKVNMVRKYKLRDKDRGGLGSTGVQ